MCQAGTMLHWWSITKGSEQVFRLLLLLLLGNTRCGKDAEGSSSCSRRQNCRWWNSSDPDLRPEHNLWQILSDTAAVVIRLWRGYAVDIHC